MQSNHDHERTTGGLCQLAAGVDDSDVYHPEIVPIGEGDLTVGLSGQRTYWDEETLQDAVDSGVFDNAKLLRGRPDTGHKPFDAQADPDNIVGDAGTFRYEPGRGPVSNGDATILDEHLAKLIDHGLVEVSPDMERELGEFDEDLDAHRVSEITNVPYITILDQGASTSASIAPARAESLGFNPNSAGADDGGTAQNSDEPAEADSGTDPDDITPTDMSNEDELAELREQLAAVKAEKEQTEQELEQTESDLESEREELDELESELEAKDEELEATEAELEAKEEEAETFRRSLAERVAQESPLSAEQITNSDMSTEDLAESVVDHEGLGEEADDDVSATELVAEQLAQGPAPRGQGGDEEETHPDNQPDEEQLANADNWAFEALSGSDVAKLSKNEQLSPRSLAEQKTGVDPAECNSRDEFARRAADGKEGDA